MLLKIGHKTKPLL